MFLHAVSFLFLCVILIFHKDQASRLPLSLGTLMRLTGALLGCNPAKLETVTWESVGTDWVPFGAILKVAPTGTVIFFTSFFSSERCHCEKLPFFCLLFANVSLNSKPVNVLPA